MSCSSGCNGSPGRWSPEWKRQFKSQNNAGCCNGSERNDCSKPSLAQHFSPLWQWEQNHGKLITKIDYSQDAQGHLITTISKITCAIKTPRPSRFGCCSLSYRVSR